MWSSFWATQPTSTRRIGPKAGGGLLLVAALLAVIVFVPPLAIDPRGLTRDQWLTHVQDLRTTILQGFGGLALLGSLYFSARTLRLTRRGQLTERFTKAVEQLGRLGPEHLAVRIGGVYALEQIALDSEELHWPVMEVLTAFVRNAGAEDETSRSLPWVPESALKERDRTPIRADLQIIATVLGRRPARRRRWEREHQVQLYLRFADLPGVRWGRAHLEWAWLTGARLEHASLYHVHLERAWLRMASLRKANLTDAHLDGAVLIDAHLEEADLTDAHLGGADLSGAYLERAVLVGVHALTRAQLAAAHVDGSTVLPSHLMERSEPADPDPSNAP
jgi:hypothetical protein